MGPSAAFVVAVAALSASPRVLVLGGGAKCGDADQIEYVRAIHGRLGARAGVSLVGLEAAGEKLRPAATSSFEEIERQLEAAQGHFYNLQLGKAEGLVDKALAQADALPPGDPRARLTIRGWLLEGLVYRERGDPKRSAEAFRHVLRLDPKYALDPNYFSPSVRADFDAERKRIASGPKVNLSIRSSPAGADVFLDGLRVGKTPFHADYAPGTYSLQVAKGEAVSLARAVDLRGAAQLHVDLEFEGAVRGAPVPCVEGADEQALLRRAVKVGALLEAEEVVLVRVERSAAGPRWLAAALISVERGQKTREGGLKVADQGSSADAMKDLVEFLVTGQVGKQVVVVANEGGPAPWSPPLEASAAAPPAATATPAAAPARPGGREGTLRPALLWGAAGTSAALLLAAGTVRVLAQPDIDTLRARQSPEGYSLSGDAQAQELRASLHSREIAIDVMLAGAGLAAAAGAGLYFWPAPSVAVAIDVLPAGAAVSIGGCF